MMSLRVLFILNLLFLSSCKPLSDNERDFIGENENGKIYLPQTDESEESNIKNPDDANRRIPTKNEFNSLFSYPHRIEESQLVFLIDEQTLCFPLDGYSTKDRQVNLYGHLGSYLTADGEVLRISEKNQLSFEEGYDNYHSLRYVYDQPTQGTIKVGNLYWKQTNDGCHDDIIVFYSKGHQSLSYKSLTK